MGQEGFLEEMASEVALREAAVGCWGERHRQPGAANGRMHLGERCDGVQSTEGF